MGVAFCYNTLATTTTLQQQNRSTIVATAAGKQCQVTNS